MNKYLTGAALAALTIAPNLLCAIPVLAADNTAITEIVVTARKRQESILNVPVVETAIASKQLQQLQTQDLKDVATLVPGLTFGDSVLSIGTQVSLRGVGTTTYDPGIDQSVSLNVDGMQFAQGLAYSSGMFDLAQIEVLKGPQSLFYGKSSPGGVISMRTADPTNKFEVIGRGGYEYEAREKRGEIIVSGPITDTLKARLAGFYDAQDGYFYSKGVAEPGTGAVTPSGRGGRLDGAKSYDVRGTVLWNPTDKFSARLKINEVHDRFIHPGTEQWVNCPGGTGPAFGFFPDFIGGNNTCQKGRSYYLVDLDPAAFGGLPNNGVPFIDTTQSYGTLELNYKLLPDLTLTSTTGIYSLHSRSSLNATMTTNTGPAIWAGNSFQRRDMTEELRLNSEFAGPVNFTAGYYYQDGYMLDHVTIKGNGDLGLFALPPLLTEAQNVISIRTNSVFGQVRMNILPKVELAAGVRWSDEHRGDNPYQFFDFVVPTGPVAIPDANIGSNNLSPELTLTYKPTTDLTVFGALKKGFKSGSYDVATPAVPNVANSFGQEEVEGGEVGVKARLDDRRIVTNLAFYDYLYQGLQVGGIIDTGSLPHTKTINAGAARAYGVDFDIAYRPEMVEGLGLNASLEWNHARFTELNTAQCYGNQSFEQGCNRDVNGKPLLPGNIGVTQSLSGQPLIRAPDWQVNFGFDYERPIGHGLKLLIADSNHYSSKYNTSLNEAIIQDAFIKADLSATLEDARDRWEIALIGKNINDAWTAGNCSNSSARLGAVLPGQFTGQAASVTANGVADSLGCFADRGREVWVRLTLKPFN